MATVQQWGRKESIIWPPRGYVYTLGAFIFACILAGLFIYIRFQCGLSPLQRYYLPYYLRTETAGFTHPVSQYQLLYVSDGKKAGRAALDSDVQPGSTPQFGGKPLPLMLTADTAKHGAFYLMRENLRNYQNKALHAWIARWIYQDVPIYKLFTMQLVFGVVAFALQLPFSIPRDIRRIKALRYGRRLKGPVLVNGKQFTKAVAGNGNGVVRARIKSTLLKSIGAEVERSLHLYGQALSQWCHQYVGKMVILVNSHADAYRAHLQRFAGTSNDHVDVPRLERDLATLRNWTAKEHSGEMLHQG